MRECQRGPPALLMRPVADGEKHEVLVLMESTTGGECLKMFVSRVGGVSHNLSCTLQNPEVYRS